MSTTSTTTSLTDAVRLHTGYLDDDEFADTMREVAKHSFEIYTFYEQFDEHHGWRIPGFTYYEDTAAFYDEHHDLIWHALMDDCEERRLTPPAGGAFHSPLQLLASLSGAWDDNQFKTLLALYALECVSRGFAEGK